MAKVCLYHGSDLDGICSAAIIKMVDPETILYPIEYGDNIGKYGSDGKIHDGDDVIVVDFVLQPFKQMKILNELSNLVWIDHHDTAISDYNEFLKSGEIKEIKGVRNTKKSACELTWEYYYPHKPAPYSVWLLGRYDIWQHHESRSIVPFQFGMKLNYEEPEDTDFWDSIFTAPRDSDIIQEIIKCGKIIIKYRKKLNEKICEVQSFKSKLMGHSCICVNRALCGSTVFDSIDKEQYDIMATFYICKKGAWNVSLYTNNEEIHVGKIAQLYGGGGHASAAGFRCSLLPFEIDT
jgi:uncharacterized protein